MVERYTSYNNHTRENHQEIQNPSQFFHNSHHSSHPSFSSSLLDAIYRSIDQSEDDHHHHHQDMVLYNETMKKKQGHISHSAAWRSSHEEDIANLQRACMIEKWMEKKSSRKERGAHSNSSSSSSDSSSAGGPGFGFFSSEPESFPVPRPKPVRTGSGEQSKVKNEGGGFLKTKSRALKIYGDLKKVKQPISPGGKLAGFLNSLFAGGKTKLTGGGDVSPSLKSGNASTCSSASSFSRSCLSKTPSSRGKSSSVSSNGGKRSVRFSPVSVIVDEHCQPCGHKSLVTEKTKTRQNEKYDDVVKKGSEVRSELMVHVMEKNRRVEEIARDLLRSYQKKNQEFEHNQFSFEELRKARVKNHVFDRVFEDDEDEEEEDDDGMSCASSDLFELDNLSAIGMERYREELPVYETTHLGTNRAIANGLIL